jgi:hypothetical protein
VDLGPAGVGPRWVGGLSGCRAGAVPWDRPAPLGGWDGQLAGVARWRAMRAMPLAHCVICAAGRYAVPFAVWSTMGEARKASWPCGSMK